MYHVLIAYHCSVSYRDLLGTAERIIEMDKQMQEVEVALGEAGHACNSRAVGKIFDNYLSYRQDAASRRKDQYSLASELAILQSCTTVMSRLLKHSRSSLLAAKILVLSRLTHKTLSQRQDSPPIVESLRNRLASLRRTLLHTIDKRLSDPDAEPVVLIEEMCAFSLATSSTPSDVLRHFHHVRLEAINQSLGKSKATHEDILNAMKLYIRTLRDSQIIFPKRLSDALSKLRLQPLLQQKDVRATSELNLRLHERWISDELRNYTPYLRHDEFQASEASKLLKSWAKQALDAFLSGTEAVLEHNRNPDMVHTGATADEPTKLESVLNLRKLTFEAWPWSGARLPGLDPAEVVDQLRDLFNDQLAKEANKTIDFIQAFTNEFQRIIDTGVGDTKRAAEPPNLWNSSLLETDLTNGATAFKETILHLYNGDSSSPEIQICISQYTAFLTHAAAITNAIRTMRETRWDTPADDDMDDSLDADDAKSTLLSHDDPLTLETALNAALHRSTMLLNTRISAISAALPPTTPQPTTASALRILRAVQRTPPLTGTTAGAALPSAALATLHAHLARSVAGPPAATLAAQWRAAASRAPAARALWDGAPPLPGVASAAAFGALRALQAGMAGAGADLWGCGAVDAVRGEVARGVGGALRGVAAEDGERDGRLQVLFDALYVLRAVAAEKGEGEGACEVERLAKSVGVGGPELVRLRKGAADYWKKTYLLFALLAG